MRIYDEILYDERLGGCPSYAMSTGKKSSRKDEVWKSVLCESEVERDAFQGQKRKWREFPSVLTKIGKENDTTERVDLEITLRKARQSQDEERLGGSSVTPREKDIIAHKDEI